MSYTKTTWQDLPNTSTPINATRLNNIEGGIENNDINIGEENYDNTRTYEVGDIVRYNEKIYKCITAITTAENFDSSKWEQTNIVEIVQSEKSKIYELIEALSTPIVGEGENITLNDTAEKRFENFDIEGNSEQETRSGKNKLQNTLESQTINGLTVVVNDDKTIKINGTATANTLLTIGTMTFIANQQYYLSGCPSGGSDSTYRIDYRTSSDAVPFIEYGQGATLNRTDDITLTAKIRIASGATLSNLIFAPMVTEGSTATPYEQYGASPSPDYPSEVKSCGDNINIYSGEIQNGVYLASNGEFQSSNVHVCTIQKTNVEAGETISVTNELNKKGMYYVIEYDTNNSFIRAQQSENGVIKASFKLGSTTKYINIDFGNSEEPNRVTNVGNIKIEISPIATEYSEYGQGCITEIIGNRNDFTAEWEQGAINDNTGENANNSTAVRTKDYIKIEPNTEYYISRTIATSYNMYYLYDKNKNLIGKNVDITSSLTTKNMQINNYNQVITFTNTNIAYFRIVDVSNNLNTKYLLQRNNITDKNYIEHQSQSYTIPTQQPMRAIGNVRDKFILKENGKWYERHNIKEVILTGNENWSQRNQGDGTNTITFNVNLLNVGAYGSNNVLCDKFVYEQNSSSGNEGIGFESTLVTQYIQINRNRLSSLNLAGFKEWISNNNIKVYYVLKIPEDIECTSEQTDILNQIYIKAKSYKGVTHIYSNDAVSPNCYVEAVKDLTTLL